METEWIAQWLADIITASHRTSHLRTMTAIMLSTVRGDCGRPLPAMHSMKPVVHNFYRKWSTVCFFPLLLRSFVNISIYCCRFTQKKYRNTEGGRNWSPETDLWHISCKILCTSSEIYSCIYQSRIWHCLCCVEFNDCGPLFRRSAIPNMCYPNPNA